MTQSMRWTATALLLLSLWGCAAPTTPTDTASEDGEKGPTELRLDDFQPGEVQVKEIESKIWMFARPEEEAVQVVTYSIARPEDKNYAILIESNEKDYAFRLELPKARFYPGTYKIKLYSDLDRNEPFKEVDYEHIDPDFYDRSPSDTIAPTQATKAAAPSAFRVGTPEGSCRLPLRGI